MNRQEIMDTIKDMVQERVGERKVDIKKVYKNNGIVLTGLSIETENNNRMAATQYIDKLVDEIESGDIELSDAIDMIIDTDSKAQDMGEIGNAGDILTSKAEILKRVHRNLVNKERNMERMKSTPHLEFCDLLIVYRVEISKHSTVLLTNDIINMVGISLEELDEAARKNDSGQWIVQSVRDMLIEKGGPDLGESPLDYFFKVVSSKSMVYGATAITDAEFMRSVASMYMENIIILPSSIHECILVPESDEADFLTTVRNMVNSVNTTEVQDIDILSDSVYRYNQKTGLVEVA